jgi:hypothetical protein
VVATHLTINALTALISLELLSGQAVNDFVALGCLFHEIYSRQEPDGSEYCGRCMAVKSKFYWATMCCGEFHHFGHFLPEG